MTIRRMTRDFSLGKAALLSALIVLGCWVSVQRDADDRRAVIEDEAAAPIPAHHPAVTDVAAPGGVLL